MGRQGWACGVDSERFAQVHRSVVVNLRAISHVKRHDNETAEIHLKGRGDVLPVSRNEGAALVGWIV